MTVAHGSVLSPVLRATIPLLFWEAIKNFHSYWSFSLKINIISAKYILVFMPGYINAHYAQSSGISGSAYITLLTSTVTGRNGCHWYPHFTLVLTRHRASTVTHQVSTCFQSNCSFYLLITLCKAYLGDKEDFQEGYQVFW